MEFSKLFREINRLMDIPPRKSGTSIYLLMVLVCLAVMGCTAVPPSVQPATTGTALPVATVLPLRTPTLTASPTPESPTATITPCTQTVGKTETIAAVTAGVKEPLQARVHLPPCYTAIPGGKTRYPVLYLLHGQGFTSDQWERLGMFAAADHMALSGSAMIVVLPNEDDTIVNPYESGFGDALVKGLVPQVDAAYPTCTERVCRAIGGLSRGASWAIYIGLKSWGQFGVIGAHSLPPFFGLERDLPGLLQSIPPGKAPHMYLDIGFSDPYRAPAASAEAILTRFAVPHEWYLNSGDHNEAYWSAHTPDYLAWYAAQLNHP